MRIGRPFAYLAGLAIASIVLGIPTVIPSAGTQPGPAMAAESFDVLFTDEGLKPVTITLPVSATVRWINQTSVTHSTVHRTPPGQTEPLWNSWSIEPNGGEFSFAFLKPGEYSYFDLFFADNVAFQGTVVVTASDTIATAEPTPTLEPTPTQPSPTPEPTPASVVLKGRLLEADPDDACAHDALLRQCFTGEVFRVRHDMDITPFIGYDVELKGILKQCEAGGGSYVEELSNIQVLPEGCGGQPTPPPPPPTREAENLALGAPVTFPVENEKPGFPSRYVNDGNLGTSWRTDLDAAWIYLDLGHGLNVSRTFNQVVLHWGTPYAVQYALYIWQNGEWNGIYQTLGSTHSGSEEINLPRIYARHVLLYVVQSSDPGGGFALREWEIYGRETVNQALGGEVSVSSAQVGHPGHFANDGNYGTFWASLPRDPQEPEENPQWILMRFPSSTYVAEVRMYWIEDAYPLYYYFVFYDGPFMRQALARSLDSYQRISPLPPIRADHFLIYTHTLPPSGVIALKELELYEPGGFSSGARADPPWSATGVILHDWLRWAAPFDIWPRRGDILHGKDAGAALEWGEWQLPEVGGERLRQVPGADLQLPRTGVPTGMDLSTVPPLPPDVPAPQVPAPDP